uniref:Uncharacterized protein n=1 Tax=Plectus sambesii TaxID=2011161 RepID=A0A914WCR6_9BILA
MAQAAAATGGWANYNRGWSVGDQQMGRTLDSPLSTHKAKTISSRRSRGAAGQTDAAEKERGTIDPSRKAADRDRNAGIPGGGQPATTLGDYETETVHPTRIITHFSDRPAGQSDIAVVTAAATAAAVSAMMMMTRARGRDALSAERVALKTTRGMSS